MSKIKVINKGYTITVVSWENDGDYYATKKIIVETVEEAEMYYKLMQLCKSKNSAKDVVTLGNLSKFGKKEITLIIDFFNNYPDQVKDYLGNDYTLDELGEDELEDIYIDLFYSISEDLLGSSEFYVCRVMESCTVTYSPEDIYLEEITFKDA